jgi:endogenous inhibitor of DNA gyrase (YacG/DUF329 family)
MPVIACRRCGKPVRYRKPEDAPYFPFCSRRCKMVDLDKWFEEEHRISTPLPPTDEHNADTEEEKPG